MQVVNLKPIHARCIPVEPLFDVGEKDRSSILFDEAQVLLPVLIALVDICVDDRALRICQKTFGFGAWNEEHSFANTSPTVFDEVARRPDVICQHDNVDAGFFGIGEQFRPRTPGVSRVFCMSMQDRTVIPVSWKPGKRPAGLLVMHPVLFDGRQPLRIETLDG